MDNNTLERGVQIQKRLLNLKKDLEKWSSVTIIDNLKSVTVQNYTNVHTDLNTAYIDVKMVREQVVKKIENTISVLEYEFEML